MLGVCCTSLLLGEVIEKVASVHLMLSTAEEAHLDGRHFVLSSVKHLSTLFTEMSKMFQDLIKTCCQANNAELN